LVAKLVVLAARNATKTRARDANRHPASARACSERRIRAAP
jgi:hypothetical protein